MLFQTPINEDQEAWVPPIFFPVLAFIGGIGWDRFFPSLIRWECLGIPLALLGYLMLRKNTPVGFCLLILLAGFAGAFHHFRVNHLFPDDHIRFFLTDDSQSPPLQVRLTGRVAGPPLIDRPEKKFPYNTQLGLKTRFLVEAQELTMGQETYRVSGLVEVSMPGMADRFRPGGQVAARGRLVTTKTTPSDFPFPTRFNYYMDNLIFARLLADSEDEVSFLARPNLTMTVLLEKARQAARALLLRDELPAGEYTPGLLTAVILGDRYQMQNDLNDAMVRIGAVHFLAVSGFNLAMLALGVWALGTLVGLSERTTILMVIVCTLVYATLTDFQPSVVRSTIMILIVSVGFLVNKPPHVLNSLAVAAGVILMLNPNQLFNAGFQLSFLSTLGLVALSGPIYHFLTRPEIPALPDPEPVGKYRFFGTYFADKIKIMFCASLAASVATLPLVMYHFHIVSVIGPAASVLLFPLASVLTLVGFAHLVLTAIFPGVSFVSAGITDLFSTLLAKVSLLLSHLPGIAFDVPPPALGLVLIYLLLIFYSLVRPRAAYLMSGWRKPALPALAVIYLTVWLTGAWGQQKGWVHVSGSSEGQTVTVHTGRGLVFIDCGSYRVGQTGDFARQVGVRYLVRPTAAILTCPDQRFFNDVWSLTEQNPGFKVFLTPGFNGWMARRYEPVNTLLSDSTVAKEFVEAGTQLQFDDVKISIVFPERLEQFTSTAQVKNGRSALKTDDGAVVLIRRGEKNILVGTRWNALLWNRIQNRYKDLRIDAVVLNSAGVAGPAVALEKLLAGLKPRRLVLTSRLKPEAGTEFRRIAKKYSCELIEAGRGGGYLIED